MAWITGTLARTLLLRAVVRTWLDRGGPPLRRHRAQQAGIEVITWVVLLSIMVAVAIAAGAIVKTKVLDTANNTPTK